MVEPINKKRKLQANGSLDKQPSFTDVLQQLEAEDDGMESEFKHTMIHVHLVRSWGWVMLIS